jgi:hypothetical protein
MRARKRGPKAKGMDPRMRQLEKENARLQRRLKQAVWINRPEEATRQIAPGTTQTDPDDPEVVPVISTYGVLAPPERIEAQLMSEAAAQQMPNPGVSPALTRSGRSALHRTWLCERCRRAPAA